MDPIELAIKAAGGPSAVAAKLGLKHPSVVTNWRERKQVPPKHVRGLERISGISRHVLCPEVFGSLHEESEAPADRAEAA